MLSLGKPRRKGSCGSWSLSAVDYVIWLRLLSLVASLLMDISLFETIAYSVSVPAPIVPIFPQKGSHDTNCRSAPNEAQGPVSSSARGTLSSYSWRHKVTHSDHSGCSLTLTLGPSTNQFQLPWPNLTC